MSSADRVDHRLTAFIEGLRCAGWNIGLQQHLDARRLLLHGRMPADAAELQHMLGPILCSSRREQIEFPHHCGPWAAALLAPEAETDRTLAVSAKGEPATTPLPEHTPVGTTFAARLLKVLAIRWPIIRAKLSTHSVPLLLALSLVLIGWAYLAIPGIPRWFFIAVLGLLVAVAVRYWRRIWDAFLTRRESGRQQTSETFSVAGLSDRSLHHSTRLARSAQRLRRHIEHETKALDVSKTLERTIRAGNWFTPVYRRAKRTPEYLVLVDRASFADHQAGLASSLVRHLRYGEQVAIDQYYFNRDPRYCTMERTDLPGRTLAELKERHPQHRLLVFSGGNGFFDAYTGALHDWIGELRYWGVPVLFRVAKVGPWQERDRVLAESGMRIFSADEQGIAAFAELADGMRISPGAGDVETPPLPNILARLAQRWMTSTPPEEREQDALIDELERYLGADGFAWLAACAIYPELHWPLTLELAQRLRVAAPTVLLAKLASLPWLRHGYLPNWLREALLDALGDQEAAIRHKVEQLLQPRPGGDLALEYVLPEPELPPTDLPLSTAAKDYVFLSFLSDRLSVRVPRLRRRLRRWWQRALPRFAQALRANLVRLRERRWVPTLQFVQWLRAAAHRIVGGLSATLYRTLIGPISRLSRVLGGRLRPSQPVAIGHNEGAIPGVAPRAFRDNFKQGAAGPEMIWLPGGTFRMGSPEGVGQDDERPVHDVALGHYAVGKYPVTVGEFKRFVEATGYRTEAEEGGGAWVWNKGDSGQKSDASWRNPYMEQDDRHPVVCISWSDAKAYCDWLGEKTGQVYGLLTEAQWEHACRAGSDTAWCFGDNESELDQYAWFSPNAGDGTRPVGEKLANAWQLHDMHGNCWEWCDDWYANYSENSEQDPSGPESGSYRVFRGGSWDGVAGGCRSASRGGYEPSFRDGYVGFRLSRTGPLHSYPFTLGPAEPEPKPEPIPGLRDALQDGSEGPSMVWLPGGVFTMGQGNSPHDDEKPAHPVRVDAFSIGQYPVTFAEYDRFCDETKRKKPNDRGWGRGKRPVINVSWEEAQAYCDWLSGQTEETYRLLTEAEWEYACRAGTQTRWSCGDEEARLGEYAWYDKNAGGKTHPVGEKAPNAWHLHDMHGNVWEWCRDWFSSDYYEQLASELRGHSKDIEAGSSSARMAASENPSGPESGSLRVRRGGSWYDDADRCRSAYRHYGHPSFRIHYLGFRLSRTGPWRSHPITLDGSRQDDEESPQSAQTVSQSIHSSSATASGGGVAVVAAGNVTVEQYPLLDEAFETLKQQLETKERALATAREKEDASQEWERSLLAALREAVSAIPKQTAIPDAKVRIKEALEEAANGNTALAEAIFSEVLERKSAEGEARVAEAAAVNKEAAEAARHLGTLAFLHDTDKALSAYRRATELDSDNGEGWNYLGHLLLRTGELNDAEMAYRKIESLGEAMNDRESLAIAYGNLGLVYQNRGDLEQAEAMCLKALEVHEGLGDKGGMARGYNNLGLVYRTRGDLEQADVMYRKALVLHEAIGDKEGMATAYGNLGIVYQNRGDLEQAEAKLHEALVIYEDIGNKERMAAVYNNLGLVYKNCGDLQQAEAMYGKALALNEAIGAKAGMASQYGNLGIVYQTRGDLEQAEAMYRKALEIQEEIGDKEGMASQYGNLGIVYQTRGDLEQAEAMHHKALGLHEAIGAKQGMANQYTNLGLVYQNRGDLQQAEAMYRKARDVHEKIGANEAVASDYVNLGLVYRTRGDLEQAEAMLHKAIELHEAIGAKAGMANGYTNLGLVYHDRGDLERAETMLHKAIELHEAIGAKDGIADDYANLGLIFHDRGDLGQAEAMLRKALERHEAIGTKQGMAADYTNLGIVYQTRGDLERAEAMLHKAIELHEAIGDKEGMAIAYGKLGAGYQSRDDLEQAEEMLLKALALNEAIGAKKGMASDYGNLGLVYQTHGDLTQAEAMLRRALVLYEDLGNKEGMAAVYNNLGIVYKNCGDLEQAEAMLRKALVLCEAIGNKEGVTNAYGNLGLVYKTRGDLTQDEAMYRKALNLFEDIGATSQVEQVRGLLEELRKSD